MLAGMMLSRRTQLMVTMRGRLQLAREAREEAEAESNHLTGDAWFEPARAIRGRHDGDFEVVTTASCFDLLQVPLHARDMVAGRRLNELMASLGWAPCRVNGVSGSTDGRLRGYRRPVLRNAEKPTSDVAAAGWPSTALEAA
jgi:hypothetical protein